MTVRAALIFLVFGFVVLILVMGVLSFVRWMKIRYPRHGSLILVALCVIVVGSAIVIAMEIRERPTFLPNDLVTLQEPVVAKITAADRNSRIETCVIDRYEHLGVVEVEGGTLTARVESNKAVGTSVLSYRGGRPD